MPQYKLNRARFLHLA